MTRQRGGSGGDDECSVLWSQLGRVVSQSAALLSISTWRQSASTAMERAVIHYINIRRDSAKAEQSAKD